MREVRGEVRGGWCVSLLGSKVDRVSGWIVRISGSRLPLCRVHVASAGACAGWQVQVEWSGRWSWLAYDACAVCSCGRLLLLLVGGGASPAMLPASAAWFHLVQTRLT
jgi:hypothetical protein